MTSEWVAIGITILGAFITSLVGYIRLQNKNDILRSEIRQKDEKIAELKEDKRILWERTQRTK